VKTIFSQHKGGQGAERTQYGGNSSALKVLIEGCIRQLLTKQQNAILGYKIRTTLARLERFRTKSGYKTESVSATPKARS